MAQARGPWKQGRKKRGSTTCPTDRANEANKMFIIWLCWLLQFWKGDRELEVRTATYGPGIDQSQHAKSFSHIINLNLERIYCYCPCKRTHGPKSLTGFKLYATSANKSQHCGSMQTDSTSHNIVAPNSVASVCVGLYLPLHNKVQSNKTFWTISKRKHIE